MSATSRLAVEVTKGDDFLNIWVDANNNGVRDDDDVNIFVSKCGNLFAESPTFKQSLDAHLKQRLQEASMALMQAGHDDTKEEEICDLALELVIKACTLPQAIETVAVSETPAPAYEAAAYEEAAPAYAPVYATDASAEPAAQWQPQSQSEQLYAQWAAQAPIAPQEPAQYTEHGIPIYRPQA